MKHTHRRVSSIARHIVAPMRLQQPDLALYAHIDRGDTAAQAQSVLLGRARIDRTRAAEPARHGDGHGLSATLGILVS